MEIKYRCECKNRHNIDKNVNEIESHDPPRTRNRTSEERTKQKHTQLSRTLIFFLPFASSFARCLFNLLLLLLLFVAASFVLQYFFSSLFSRSRSLYRREYKHTEKNRVYELHVWKLFMTDSDGRKSERAQKPFCDGCMRILCVYERHSTWDKRAVRITHNFFFLSQSFVRFICCCYSILWTFMNMYIHRHWEKKSHQLHENLDTSMFIIIFCVLFIISRLVRTFWHHLFYFASSSLFRSVLPTRFNCWLLLFPSL